MLSIHCERDLGLVVLHCNTERNLLRKHPHYLILGPHGTGVFIPSVCPNASFIGQNCDILNKPCDIVKPCQNNGTCYNNDIVTNGYVCLCLTGFDGTRCELDHRPCKPDTCWNNGITPRYMSSAIKIACFFFLRRCLL